LAGREPTDTDGAADLLGGHADGFGERRKGELHLGELLNIHARAHRGRHDLDGFSRVFAEHVGAEDGAAVAVGDELTEAVGMTVCHGPDEVVIPGDSHGDVVVAGGLVLGHPDRAVLGVGEAAAGHHVVAGLAGGGADSVPSRDTPFEPGGLDKLG
jgi:hypothetical protein